jgi:hypothetical protein
MRALTKLHRLPATVVRQGGNRFSKKKQVRYLFARSLLNQSQSCQEILNLKIDLFFNPINYFRISKAFPYLGPHI